MCGLWIVWFTHERHAPRQVIYCPYESASPGREALSPGLVRHQDVKTS